MPLGGILKNKQHLILSSFDLIMELPITEKELDIIIELTKNKNSQLYNKLWSYRFNYLNKDKKDYGIS
jgi:hypothetical protein